MPVFALDLDPNGVRLLRRDSGKWNEIGCVTLDDPALAASLTALRKRGEATADGVPFETELIIPDSQILYTTVAPPATGTHPDDAWIRARLAGLTPCPVDELRFDWRVTDKGVAIAALDVNTLDEAEGFTVPYGFNPVRFRAWPDEGRFPGRPDFGPTEFAAHNDAPDLIFTTARDADQAVGPDVDNVFTESGETTARPPSEPPRTEPPAVRVPRSMPRPVADRGPRKPAPAPAAARRRKAQAVPSLPAPERSWKAIASTLAVATLAMAALIGLALYLVRPDGRGAEIALAPPPEPEVALPFTMSRTGPGSGAAPAGPAVLGAGDGVPLPPLPGSEPAPSFAGGAGAAMPGVLPDIDPAEGRSEAVPDLTAIVVQGPGPDLLTPGIVQGDTVVPPERMKSRGLDAEAGPGALGAGDVVIPPDTLYAADMWQTPSPPPPLPAASEIDTLYLASIDPAVRAEDAFALVEPNADYVPPSPPFAPPERGQQFDLDGRGLVVATPEGAITPDGIVVTLGLPPAVPPLRPVTAVIAANEALALALAGKPPRPRPDTLVSGNERARFGGRTRDELAALAPLPRPQSRQQAAAAATEDDVDAPPSAFAVAQSVVPRTRPAELAQTAQVRAAIESARAASAATAAAPPPVRVQPSIPTTASVARQATITNAINLRRINLIGVYGSDNDRRALVRLQSGRLTKVKVGDRLDGGRVSAIGDGSLRYKKGSRSVTLVVPSG